MRRVIVLLFTIFFSQSLLGQVILEGDIVNTNNKALSRINIMVYKPDSDMLVAFGVSDDKGSFKTKVNIPSDSLDIKVSSIQFINQKRRIANNSQQLHFELEPGVQKIKGVTVKASPIKQFGDTISYLVSSFAGKEDRGIEDVLRRMPGIEVEPSGRILYQGVSIKKFYVEGLDLMDGRYVVVSKNLPQSSVSTVEILENHQPLRILEERVASRQASLNLKLKRNITTTGTAKLGVGYSPFLRDVNITPMTFTKGVQVVSSYQTNNTGNDVSQQLKAYTIQDIINSAERPKEDYEMLGIKTVSTPFIDKSRYLDNNIHLLNFNGLQSIGHDYQLRVNLYYINDKQKQQASLQRTLYSPTDTLVFTEDFDNQIHDDYLYGKITLNRNVKKNYLNNELKIKTRWDSKKGLVYAQGKEVNQSLRTPLQSISNEMKSINPIGEHLVEFNSYISYDNSPHSLNVSPGQFDEVLNQDVAYDKVEQQVDLERFYANHSANFVFSWKSFVVTPRIGISFRQQSLQSNIFITQHNEEEKADSDFSNKLESAHTNAFVQTDVEYKYKAFAIKGKLPISWQHIYLNSKIRTDQQDLTRILFSPKLSLNYTFCNFWKIYSVCSFSNNFGDIDNVFYGYVLKNYRNLSRNAVPLSQASRYNTSLHLSYRNPITSFFNTLSYVYSLSNNNLLYDNVVQDDGTMILQAFDIANNSYTQNLHLYSSKYFPRLKITLSVRADFNQRKGKSFMNHELFDAKTRLFNIKPELNIPLSNWISLNYGMNKNYIQTFIDNGSKSNISIFRHNLDVFVFPADHHSVSLSSEYYENKDNNNLFVDLRYSYNIPKKKIDIEASWNNIFNNHLYTTYQSSSFMVWQSTYFLRPSQIFLAVKFSF